MPALASKLLALVCPLSKTAKPASTPLPVCPGLGSVPDACTMPRASRSACKSSVEQPGGTLRRPMVALGQLMNAL